LISEGSIFLAINKESTLLNPSISISNNKFELVSVKIGLTLDKLEDLNSSLERISSNKNTIWTKFISFSINPVTEFYVEITDIRGNKYYNKFNNFLPGMKYIWDLSYINNNSYSILNSTNNQLFSCNDCSNFNLSIIEKVISILLLIIMLN